MPYYRGDYLPGYYRGDPGLGSILGGALKVGGALITGGPTKAISTAVSLVKPKGSPVPMIAPPNIPISTFGAMQPPAVIDVPRTTPGAVPTPGLGGTISRILPGGKSGYEIGLRGYHVSKSGKIVKNRRMNVVNPRALRRAIRRAAGFGKIVSRMKRAFARANTAVGNRPRAVRRRGR